MNTQGAADALKRFHLFNFFKNELYADFLLLQDTQTSQQLEQTWRLVWKGHIYFSHSYENSGGLAILAKPNLAFRFLGLKEIVKGRALYLKIEIDQRIYNLLNIYAPSKSDRRLDFF